MLGENLSGVNWVKKDSECNNWLKNEMGEYVEKCHVESDTKKEIRKLDLMGENWVKKDSECNNWLKNEMGEYVEKCHVESDTKKEIRKLHLMVENEMGEYEEKQLVGVYKDPILKWVPVKPSSRVPSWSKDNLPEEEIVKPDGWRAPTPPKVDISLANFCEKFRDTMKAHVERMTSSQNVAVSMDLRGRNRFKSSNWRFNRLRDGDSYGSRSGEYYRSWSRDEESYGSKNERHRSSRDGKYYRSKSRDGDSCGYKNVGHRSSRDGKYYRSRSREYYRSRSRDGESYRSKNVGHRSSRDGKYYRSKSRDGESCGYKNVGHRSSRDGKYYRSKSRSRSRSKESRDSRYFALDGSPGNFRNTNYRDDKGGSSRSYENDESRHSSTAPQ